MKTLLHPFATGKCWTHSNGLFNISHERFSEQGTFLLIISACCLKSQGLGGGGPTVIDEMILHSQQHLQTGFHVTLRVSIFVIPWTGEKHHRPASAWTASPQANAAQCCLLLAPALGIVFKLSPGTSARPDAFVFKFRPHVRLILYPVFCHLLDSWLQLLKPKLTEVNQMAACVRARV